MGRTIHLLTRITLLLCTMCISLQLLAQTRTVSVKADGQKVADVLKIIEQQSGFTFFYNDAAFDKNRRISIDAQNKDVLAVLEEVQVRTSRARPIRLYRAPYSIPKDSPYRARPYSLRARRLAL